MPKSTKEQNIKLSNLDKILYPEDNITKQDIIDYYKNIADYILPLIKNRPLTLKRFPNGINTPGFFQKNTPDYFPDWIETIKISKKTGGSTSYILCNNLETLIYLANLAMLEPHIWLSTSKKIKNPDRVIFDFDSEKPQFKNVCHAAKLLKKILDDLKLESFVMTTGSKGLHVVIPIQPIIDFDKSKDFARKISQQLLDNNPELFTLEVHKKKRQGKIFIDFLRNAFTQTGVAPYGVRAKPGAPVATPLFWDELDDPKLTSQKYNIKNIFKRLSKIPDPWEKIDKIKQKVPKL